jgi:hypothetical protein
VRRDERNFFYNNYAVTCGVDGKGGRAAALNGLFERRASRKRDAVGTIDWLCREYKNSKRYRERVSERTRQDYDLMQIVLDLPTKRGDRVGQRPVLDLARARRWSRYAGQLGGSPSSRLF